MQEMEKRYEKKEDKNRQKLRKESRKGKNYYRLGRKVKGGRNASEKEGKYEREEGKQLIMQGSRKGKKD